MITGSNWVVYILRCSDGSYYCGITKDIVKRIEVHNSGRGSKYTRSRLPVELMVCRDGFSLSSALKLERIIKKQKREDKIEFLIGYGVI